MPRILSAASLLRERTCDVERPAVQRDGAVVPVERIGAAQRAIRTAQVAQRVELEQAALDPRLRIFRLRVRRLAIEPPRLERAPVESLERRLREQRVDGERVPRVRLRGKV